MDPKDYQTVQIGVSKFWANKYAADASRNWDKFYKRNEARFFRDRHWTDDETTDGFPCLGQIHTPPVTILEAGCGAGNCAFPLLSNPSLTIRAFDFAPSAVSVARARANDLPTESKERFHAFEWDLCDASSLPTDADLPTQGVDYIILVFVLSAIPPSKQVEGIRNLVRLLRPGGRLLFRDYATEDLAMSRFKSRNRIDDKHFVRQDGTLAVFFDETDITTIMTQVGLVQKGLRRVRRVVHNRKEKLEMHRVFLHGEFERVVASAQTDVQEEPT